MKLIGGAGAFHAFRSPELTVHAAIVFIFVLGMIIIFYEDIELVLCRIKMINRLKARKNEDRQLSGIREHLDLTVKTGISENLTWKHLVYLSLAFFFAIFTAGIRIYSLTFALPMSLAFGFLPYAFLRIRIESTRNQASFEGESLAALILSKYRMCGYNIQRALELSSKDKGAPEVSGRALSNVLINLAGTGDEEVVRGAFKSFEFTVNTNWARLLSYNMQMAYLTGINVSDAIENLLRELQDVRGLTEERKRMNAETGRLVLFMAPVSYVLSVMLAVKFVGIKPGLLLRNQFMTPEGFAFITVIILMFFGNILLVKLIENKRFDY